MILRVPCKYLKPVFFFFDLPLKLRVVYLRNKPTNSLTNMEFYKHVQYCFCCYVIKSAGEAANKVLLSVVWNPLLIEINLFQIRTLNIKRERVCAVCPYLLFIFVISELRYLQEDSRSVNWFSHYVCRGSQTQTETHTRNLKHIFRLWE